MATLVGAVIVRTTAFTARAVCISGMMMGRPMIMAGVAVR